MTAGWIGVDFDGTVARDSDARPIEAMVNRIKRWLNLEIEVRIVTARVSLANGEGLERVAEERKQVEEWCEAVFGRKLPVTCEKDKHMYQLWDDRAIQVIKDTGERVGNVNRPRNGANFHHEILLDEETGYLRFVEVDNA